MPAQISQHRRRAAPGGALVGLGLSLLLAMIAVPERLNVPPPIGYVVAGAIVLAGLLALANVFCGREVRAWLAVALLICMVVPAVWIAFGPGQRSCSLELGFLLGWAHGAACRVAFGIASVFGLMLVLVALRYALKSGENEG